MLIEEKTIRVLLVEDDAEDASLIRELLGEVEIARYELDWVATHEEGIARLRRNEHDVCLLDYFLNAVEGSEVLKVLAHCDCRVPIIILTGRGNLEVDLAAMQAGAMDYLEKGATTADLLERSIRYAIQRRKGELELRESEERFRGTFENASIGITHIDLNGNWLRVNPRFCELLGFTREELEGKRLWDLTHPDDIIMDVAPYAQLIRGNIDHYELEKRYIAKDGRIVWAYVSRALQRDQAGKPLYAITNVVDITERKRMEAEISMLARFPGENPTPVMRLNREFQLIYCNDACRLLLKSWDIRVGQCAPEALRAAAEEAWTTDRSVEMEAAADGRNYSLILTPIGDQNYINVYGRDITDRKRAEEALRESEMFYRQTLESIPGMVFTTRPDGYCDYQSQQWVEYTGVPMEEMVGDGWNKLLHPDDRPLAFAAWRTAVEGRAPYDLEYRVRRHDGEYEWFKVRGRPIRDGAGEIVRWFGVATSIDEFKRAEEALRVANERLKEADRRKDEFMAMLAHELRNPLAPIRYAVQMLNMTGPGQEHLIKQREVIDRQVSHMSRLLDDLLDISRITRGKITLKREIVDLRAVATQALDSLRPMIEGRGQHLLYEGPSASLLVEGDPTRLEQIIRNLLHNANKYTEAGGCIKLSLGLDTDHERAWRAVVRVSDSGIGIAPEVLPLVFEAFVQAEQGLARSQGGLGIGLAMVRNLVQLHGGSVEAHSAGPGRGSEFVVKLPLAQRATAEPERAEPGEAGRKIQAGACRVLVVDDNEDAAASLSELLRLWGHEVQTTYDGHHALAAAREWRPEVILLDIGLPGMDGYQVAGHLRREPVTERAYIVALTGYGAEEDRRRAQEAGFDHHLTKPVEMERLQTILKRPCTA